jgi:nitrate/nitrite-specific signal transduction histidine kinase
MIFQVAVLSHRFAHGFELAEYLSEELKQKSDRLEETAIELTELTSNLEKKVEERTKNLEETKSEVEALNHFTHIINSLSNLKEIFVEISK